MTTQTKRILLDIDGVMVPWRGRPSAWLSRNAHGWLPAFDAEAVVALNTLTEQLDAEIVLCSSWRKRLSLLTIQSKFSAAGVRAQVIGVTPDRMNRARDVAAWLAVSPPDVRWSVIDDDHEGELTSFAWSAQHVAPIGNALALADVPAVVAAMECPS